MIITQEMYNIKASVISLQLSILTELQTRFQKFSSIFLKVVSEKLPQITRLSKCRWRYSNFNSSVICKFLMQLYIWMNSIHFDS